MKKVIRPLLLIAIAMFAAISSYAQCTVSNIIIQNIRNVVPGTGTCQVTFDVSFDIQNNNGNKYIFVHAWTQAQYPNYFNCVDGHPSSNGAIHAPESDDLADAFMNIGINNNLPNPQIIMTYPPDNAVPMTTVGSISRTVLPDGSANFILQGVTVTVPVSCGTPTVLIADLWSSQSAQAQNAHCVNCGIMYSAGFMGAQGIVNCASLTYNVTVTNNTATPLTGNYRVFADINGDAYFSPSVDTMIVASTNFSIAAGPGTTTFLTGPIPTANRNQGVFIVFTQTSGAASGASRVVYIPSTQCSPLPVTFSGFTARRTNSSNVLLRWETATEINNRGFVIQRNVNGTWESIGYIPSQAADGNSTALLTYTLNDPNASRNITQYRIQQVDLDGKARLSEIRTVKGYGQDGTTLVYPNPSTDGTVRIVFDDRDGQRDVILADMNGRVVKEWKVMNGNTIEANGLKPGVYVLRIVMAGTREQTVEKIVVTGSK